MLARHRRAAYGDDVNLGALELLIIVFMLFPFALMVVALIDAVRRDRTVWDAAGQNQIVWILLILLIGCIGPILYLTLARPKLVAAQNRP